MKYIILIFFISLSLCADTVIYKNGKVDENVKTTLSKTSILIQYEDGKQVQLNKKLVKQVKFAITIWLTNVPKNLTKSEREKYIERLEVEEERRLAVETEEGNEWISRPQNEQIAPAQNGSFGLIPGYSGLFRTDEERLGFAFASMEVISFVLAATFHNQAGNKKIDFTGTGDLERQKNLSSRNILLGLGFSLLFLDSYLSFQSAKQWNQGTYIGEKSGKKPTDPISRLWRSALFPGWGQYYGGNTTKGSIFMGTNILLFAGNMYTMNEQNFLKRDLEFSGLELYILSDLESNDSLNLSFLFYYANTSSLSASYNNAKNKTKYMNTTYIIFYLYNLFDSYFNSGIDPTSLEEETALRFHPGLTFQPANDLGRLTMETYYSGTLEWRW